MVFHRVINKPREGLKEFGLLGFVASAGKEVFIANLS